MPSRSDHDSLDNSIVRRTNDCWLGDPDRDESIYVAGHQLAVRLDKTALTVWRMLDGQRTAGQIAEALAVRYAGDAAEIRRQIMDCILELERLGLVAWRLRPLFEEVDLP